MSTFVLIEKYTVGAGGVSSVTLGSGGTIPQTYTDLVVKLSVRKSDTSANIRWTINGASSGYSERMVYNADGVAYSTSAASAYLQLLYATTSSLTANTFSNGEMYFPNYTNASYKSISIDNTQENNGTSIVQNLTAGLWSNTSAITSLTFGVASGSFTQYSTFYLYGILKA